jgi:hypothetical protein
LARAAPFFLEFALSYRLESHTEEVRVALPETIDSSGYPLGFKTRQGSARPGVITSETGLDVFTVEARQLPGHQKEAVVTEGTAGSGWRMVSDEGVHIKGNDLAPLALQ